MVAVEDLNAEGDASDAGFAAAWHVKWQEECGEISADISKPVKARSLWLGKPWIDHASYAQASKC